MRLLRGMGFPPWLVGTARGFAEAVALGALAAASVWILDGDNVPDNIEFVVPAAVWVIRSLEGLADQIDPAKSR